MSKYNLWTMKIGLLTCLLACYLPDSYARYRSSDFTGAAAVKSDVASRVLSVSRETGELAIRGRRRIAVRELVEKLKRELI